MKHFSLLFKLYRRYWLQISLSLILALSALLANIGLLILSGWFLSASALAGIMMLAYFNYMLPAAGVRAAAMIRTAGRYADRLVSHDVTFKILAKLRMTVFQKLLPLTPSGIAQFKQADLLNRFIADIDVLDHLYLRLLSPLFCALFTIAIVTFGLTFVDPSLALLLGSILFILLIATPVIFYHSGAKSGQQLTLTTTQYRFRLIAWLQGQAELTIFNALNRYEADLYQSEQRWLENQKKQANLNGIAMGFIILSAGFTTLLILWLTANGVAGEIHGSAFTALFVFASLALFEAIIPLTGAFQQLSQVVASAKNVNEILSQPKIVHFPDYIAIKDSTVDVAISELSFTYPNETSSVLNGITLSAKTGEHLALLGKTGCGKSTLLQLITRAWDPQQGTILLNNKPIADYDEKNLRSLISVVNQRVHIFNDTLRENLLIAAPNSKDAKLFTILQQVGLNNLLQQDGLETWLGEGGRLLSGGEQRRIAIARALLHQAPLLLLDEPTEGLDNQTEQEILQLIKNYAIGKTMILVTHRLTALETFDKIVVMDNGRILEQGTHSQLLALQGEYARYKKQIK